MKLQAIEKQICASEHQHVASDDDISQESSLDTSFSFDEKGQMVNRNQEGRSNKGTSKGHWSKEEVSYH